MCGDCRKVCPANAVIEKDKAIQIDYERVAIGAACLAPSSADCTQVLKCTALDNAQLVPQPFWIFRVHLRELLNQVDEDALAGFAFREGQINEIAYPCSFVGDESRGERAPAMAMLLANP